MTDDENREYWNKVESDLKIYFANKIAITPAKYATTKDCGCSFSGVDYCKDCK